MRWQCSSRKPQTPRCQLKKQNLTSPSPPSIFLKCFLCEGISSSMNFDEEEDDEDEISSSSSQLNSNTRPGSATSKKSCKVSTRKLQDLTLYGENGAIRQLITNGGEMQKSIFCSAGHFRLYFWALVLSALSLMSAMLGLCLAELPRRTIAAFNWCLNSVHLCCVTLGDAAPSPRPAPLHQLLILDSVLVLTPCERRDHTLTTLT